MEKKLAKIGVRTELEQEATYTGIRGVHISNLCVILVQRRAELLQITASQRKWSGLVSVFPGGSVVKNPAAMQKMQEIEVRFLVRKDPLEKGMAAVSSSFAWEIPWTEEPGGLQSTELLQSMQLLSRTQPND